MSGNYRKPKTETFYLGIKNRTTIWDSHSLWWPVYQRREERLGRGFVMTEKCIGMVGSALVLLCLSGPAGSVWRVRTVTVRS